MDRSIEVSIHSKFPIFIRADPDSFGAMFAAMDNEEQVSVLKAMVEHMKPYVLQWDYIGIELEKPENAQILSALRDCLFPAE